MPRDFPNLDSLKRAAASWKFRQPNEGETESGYRSALADHVQPHDLVESMEIRTSHGWDQMTDGENRDMIRRAMFTKDRR